MYHTKGKVRQTNASVLLSGGSLLWLNIKEATHVTRPLGYDGIELLPTRRVVNEMKKLAVNKELHAYESYIKGIHHNWRLDIGKRTDYHISLLTDIFFTIIRFLFFPSKEKALHLLTQLSTYYYLPITVHHISDLWTKGNDNQEFAGGVNYEIINDTISKDELSLWLQEKNHGIVLDTRDDQSLVWGKKNGFSTWQELWDWIGVEKIKNVQLTLIGGSGISKILSRKQCLAEEQLLWLHAKKWKGPITVEVNPIALFICTRMHLFVGLKTIAAFVKTTLIKGERWSTS